MSRLKDNALQEYKEECFKQTKPYQFEITCIENEGEKPNGDSPISALGTIIYFPDDVHNILNFEGINTEYIIFVCRDGVLSDNAIGKLIEGGNGADIIYCDEDFTNDVNADFSDVNVSIRARRTPWRKPQYSPDTLLSFPYIETVFAIRTSFARMVPALKKSSEIEDNIRVWDFLLRATEMTSSIAHVSKILYHRDLAALIGNNDLLDVSDEAIYKKLMERYEKPGYQLCREAAEKRRGLRVAYESALMRDDDLPLVSIIIPSKDNAQLLKECIRNIRINAGNVAYEIIIVDNGSNDKTKDMIEDFVMRLPKGLATYVYSQMDFDFSAMCNIGAKEARGDYLLFLNDDVETVCAGFVDKLLMYASMPHVGAVGAKLLYPNDMLIQHVGITNINRGPTHKLITCPDDKVYYYCRNYYAWNVLAVTGACLMIAREKYFQVGGFSDKMKVSYNDVDLCVKLVENGYFNVVNNECVLIHHESLSRGSDAGNDDKNKRLQMERKYFYEAHEWLRYNSDPFYSTYLDQDTIEYKSIVVADYQITDFRDKYRQYDKVPARESSHVKMNIENCDIERGIADDCEDAYVISGWAINEKKDNALVKKYMVFIPLDEENHMEKGGIVASVSSKYRTDIKEVFNEAVNVYLSGFYCRIPFSALDINKKYRLGVIVKQIGRFGKSRLALGDIYEPGRGIITEK